MSFCFLQNYCVAGFLDDFSAFFRVDLPVEKSLHFSLQMFLLAFCRAETQVKIFFNPYVKWLFSVGKIAKEYEDE